MADYIIGYPPAVTVDGNDIYWPADTVNHVLWDRDFSVGDYIANTDDADSKQITAIGGVQGDGRYKMSVADASGWATGERCAPQRQAGLNHYTAPTAAYTAASDADVFYWYFSDTNDTLDWANARLLNGKVAKQISMLGALFPYVQLYGIGTYGLYLFDTTCAAENDVEFAYLVCGSTTRISFGDTASKTTFKIHHCIFIGCYYVYPGKSKFGSYIRWCASVGNNIGFYSYFGPAWSVENCTAIGCSSNGFRLTYDGAGYLVRNCLAIGCGIGMEFSDGTENDDNGYNTTDDATALDGDGNPVTINATQANVQDIARVLRSITGQEQYGLIFDPRVLTGSDQIDAGTDLGLSGWENRDIDLQDCGDNNPRGCSVGLSVVDPDTVIDTAGGNWSVSNLTGNPDRVLASYTFGLNDGETGTFDEAARNTDPGEENVLALTAYKILNVDKVGNFDLDAWETARNTDPGENNVLAPIDYKIQNVAKQGSYTPGGTPPTEPTVSLSQTGETTVQLATTCDLATNCTVYTWSGSTWDEYTTFVGTGASQTIDLTDQPKGLLFVKVVSTGDGGSACNIATIFVESQDTPAQYYRVIGVEAVPGSPFKRLQLEAVDAPVNPVVP